MSEGLDTFEWVALNDYQIDSIHVRNSGAPDEFEIFDVREDTAHGAWLSATEGSYVDLDDAR
ncbi:MULTISPECIES: DUF7511 domain-containing protein [Halobacteriales]|uniref:DUF7511 domain-containing protein n=2 Tax=Halobacteriales TaxID=2235 RepID=A0A1I0QZJ8_9EURY|nr:hypothetical protein [Natrinema salifodinae]SEW33125.1 hypothetical protein SAMN05216285_4208 [Natrinema salifodinae]